MPLKVAILIPCYGDPKLKFMASLIGLINHFHTANITDPEGNPLERVCEVFIVSTSNLLQSRHKLMADAVYYGADYALWLDADHVFPKDALARLWAHNLPVVGCNYARRCLPTAPTAAKIITNDKDEDEKNLVYTTNEKAATGEIEEVSHLGLGLCLMDMRCLDAVQAKAEEKGQKNFLPLFKFETSEDGQSEIGEDVFFFNKLRDAGINVYCDHALSWEVGHIHEATIFNSTAVAQKEKWGELRQQQRSKYEEKAAALEGATP